MKSWESKRSNRHLAYDQTFKDFISAHPKVLEQALEAISLIKDETKEIVVGNLKLARIEGSTWDAYKAEIDDEAFFVKVKTFPTNQVGSNGFEEFHSTFQAGEILKDFELVEVVDASLGYRDSNHAYFVSKWNDKFNYSLEEHLEKLKKFIEENPGNAEKETNQFEELQKRFRDIKSALKGYYDVFEHNMAFDPESNKIIIFDVESW